ncbi:HEPN domain-containing protein [Kitasatospora sp. NPDC047058]|uniref:HEPN domain-containing protein n=1 Tax=Kitasatospora sp. NPDC047058 TaxID=3155620 RepID=UPI0033E2B7F2
MGEETRIVQAYGQAHRSLLDDAVPDIERLVEFHEKETGTGRGYRRPDIQVVSRSAVVLICASWEAFCEDLVVEALQHLADHSPNGLALPDEVKKTLKASLLADKHELAIWNLADDGWRTALRDRATLISSDDDRSLNTPKPAQVKGFFNKYVGIGDITASWAWHKNDQERTSKLLEDFVVLRGSIAHRRSPAGGVRKKKATDGLDLVQRLAAKSAECVSEHLLKHTGTALPELDPPVT